MSYLLDRFVVHSADHVTAVVGINLPRGTLMEILQREPGAIEHREVHIDVVNDAASGRVTATLEDPEHLPPRWDRAQIEKYAAVWYDMAKEPIRKAAARIPVERAKRSWVDILEAQRRFDGLER